MFVVKVHQGPHGLVLVVSDKEILGKKFEEGDLQLDLTKSFYQGEEKDEEAVKKLARSTYILHLTGEKTVEMFTKLGLVDKSKVLKIKSIPHAEVYLAEN